jgi:hypothetical protein
MKMKIELIECEKIAVPQARRILRTIDKEFAANLARSIALEGMYQPIVVRQDPKRPGRFLVVQGLHRLYAKKDILKKEFIECIVLPEMDDAKYELAMISGNLWRLPLSDAQQTLAVKRWYEFYQSEQVSRPGRSGSTTDDARGDRPTSRRVPGLAAKIANASGVRLRQAERYLRIAKAFDVEQLKVLERNEVTSKMCTEIAKIPNRTLRGAAVDLIAQGTSPKEAIRQVMKRKVSSQGRKGAV